MPGRAGDGKIVRTHAAGAGRVMFALRTLVLNADYRPLCVWPLSFMTAQEAIKTVYRDRAAVVEEWDAVFRSATKQIRVPKVIALRHYAPIDSAPKFCRRSILLRGRTAARRAGMSGPDDQGGFCVLATLERAA
jgi:hypothetical protein